MQWSWLFLLAVACSPGVITDSGERAPDVRAVLFYDPGTSHADELLSFFLPGLYERYGTRLAVSGIDLSQPAGEKAYRAAAESLDLAPQPPKEPVVVIGDRAVVGLVAIAGALGDDFENIAGDPNAKRWPSISAVEDLVPAGVEQIKRRMTAEGKDAAAHSAGRSLSDQHAASHQIANNLAIAVLLGMVVAVMHSFARLRRNRRVTGRAAQWALVVTLLAGLGVSAYTAYTALADVSPMCGPVAGCAAVQDSDYSRLFGVPMGVLGLVGYSAILLTSLLARHLSPQGGGWHWLPWILALFGVLFSLRLTALEPFVIGATCVWCLGSAVSITLAFWLLSGLTTKGTGRV
jgi:uncharacterized membrane protein